jgi:lipid-A-disaccharide synthase-like uncharacterized protein
MNEYVYKIFGIVGLLIITTGIFSKKETAQDKVFATGGIFLLLYSIHLHDPIFITLQAVFILASLYEIYKLYSKNKNNF